MARPVTDDPTAGAAVPALEEHPAPERVVVARGLLAGPTALVTDDLYAVVRRGVAHRTRTAATLEPDSRLDTNTYFGRFPASYWQRWTTVGSVRVSATTTGAARVAVLASDAEGGSRTVAAAQLPEGGPVELDAALDRFLDGGALWLQVTSGAGEVTVADVEWSVAADGPLRPAAVAICTYNRAEDCARTVATLAADAEVLAGLDAIYVVDQGTDRVSGRPEFRAAADELGEKLVYRTQPNLGGAGGFTRGLYEVADVAGAEHANVIFMDDDIVCEPETVLRLNTFAGFTVAPVLVGAQMLYQLHPDRLHVGAETADLARLRAGIPVAGALHDTNVVKKHQEVRVDATYNAWWSCLIPSEVVADVGYPLPLFFQWDDIEYGYRARAAGHPTVTLPGAGVWHADFAWKDRDDWARYFSARNSLVVAALHSEMDGAATARHLAKEWAKDLVGMRYGMVHTAIRGVEDFLAGPEVLADGGTAVAAAIRAERREHPETVPVPPTSEAAGRFGRAELVPAGPSPSSTGLTMAKRLAWAALGRTVPGPVSVSAKDAQWWHLSLFERVVVTDASQGSVRVLERDGERARALARRAATVLRRLAREAGPVSARYRAALPELSSRDTWTRLFDSAG